MASLTPASTAAIARLRTYVPPASTWHSLPLAKRAAVLILLFADKKGELRVVLTMRAATLKSYAGQAALPGGKTDSLSESPLHTARREAFEEIGLPLPSTSSSTLAQPSANDTKYNPPTPSLPHPFQLDHLCQLPTHMAKTELGVRPCVAFLSANSAEDRQGRRVDAESMLIPRLDAKEVAAVFSAPLHNFLRAKDKTPIGPGEGLRQGGPAFNEDLVKDDGTWYEGVWTSWHNMRFRMHNFYVPIRNQTITRPKLAALQQVGSYPAERSGSTIPYSNIHAKDEDALSKLSRYRVWGMTARILVDCARIAYGEEPDFQVNKHFGDEAMIGRMMLKWQAMQQKKQQEELEDEDRRAGESLDASISSGNRAGKL